MTDTVRERLDQARDHLAAAERSLTERPPGLTDLHATVDGAMQVTTALADLVATLMRQAPDALAHISGPVLNELLADLRATHGCLTTGPLLLAPAREDLHHLVSNLHAEPMADDTVPAHDRADQQRPARPEPVPDEQAFHGITDVLEADLADVIDQRRDAPILDDSQPWPEAGYAAAAHGRRAQYR
ncbi:hypothetical protein [Actinokineospora sp. HUAS TT18]|uniref:hypothetical protein n=1 Tax=Actinokineospora sp. HUAS TT18 TaxID=3447451 RepID=UPI003F51E0F5